MQIVKYHPTHKEEWNKFVTNSKNGTFLFYRDYMEYHQERFQDYSIIVRDTNNEILALLPANMRDNQLYSHEGLSFGGLIVGNNMKTPLMLQIFDMLLTYLKSIGCTHFVYKTVPGVYHIHPAEEDRYALFIANAFLQKRSIFTVVNCRERLPFQSRRIRSIKKAVQAELTVTITNDLQGYWALLENLLHSQHQVKPVHTIQEISYLKKLFVDNIKLYACFNGTEMLAGVLVYESTRVARAQYIAANEDGKQRGALDLIFDYLINKVYLDKYFDFSSSDMQESCLINTGLIEQKEGFGGRSIVFDQYLIDLSNWEKGNCEKALS